MMMEMVERGRFRLRAYLARTAEEVRAAQRLRHRVFVGELGARTPANDGLDRDRFDDHCEHLVVQDVVTGEVVGTYRILSSTRAREAGGFYSETEFHLTALLELPGLVELGRACVHPHYRHGAVLGFLWSALAAHIRAGSYEHVIGCASIPARDDGGAAASLYERLARDHLSPPSLRALPRHPLPLAGARDEAHVAVPPLLRGYLRMGAYVCGPPALDEAFGTADVLVLLPMRRLEQRYRQHLLRAA
jgi:putative hemolysin